MAKGAVAAARVVVGVYACAVAAQAGAEHPALAELDLVLHVQACLVRAGQRAVAEVVVIPVRRDVDGVDQVQRRHGAVERVDAPVEPGAVVVEAHGPLVRDGTRPVAAFDLRVHDPGLFGVGSHHGQACHAALVGRQAPVAHLAPVVAAVQVAQVVAQRELVVQPVLQQPAHAGVALVVARSRTADVDVRGRPARRRLAVVGDDEAGFVLLVLRQQGEAGALAQQCEGGGDVAAVGAQAVPLRARFALEHGQPCQRRALFIDGATDVGRELAPVVAAEFHAHFALHAGARALGDGIDQAAGRGLAVQHRGRAVHDFQPLQSIRLQVGHEAVVDHAHAVPVQARARQIETAHGHVVIGDAVVHGTHARAVAHGFGHAGDGLVADLGLADDADLLRRLQQRHIHLHGRGAAARPVAGHGAPGAFMLGIGQHVHGGQRMLGRGPGPRTVHGPAAFGRARGLQLVRGEQGGKPFVHAARAAQRRRLSALDQGWIEREGDACLARKAVQAGLQITGRQVEPDGPGIRGGARALGQSGRWQAQRDQQAQRQGLRGQGRGACAGGRMGSVAGTGQAGHGGSP